jgi:hypothetical protein
MASSVASEVQMKTMVMSEKVSDFYTTEEIDFR